MWYVPSSPPGSEAVCPTTTGGPPFCQIVTLIIVPLNTGRLLLVWSCCLIFAGRGL
jgi:hypothetical protein